MKFRLLLRTDRAARIKARLDTGGAGTGKLKAYNSGGSIPATVDAAATGTLLTTLTALTVTDNGDGTLTIAATAATGAADGAPDYVRLTALDDTAWVQMTSGVDDVTKEVNWDDTIHLGGPVSITPGTITESN